MTPTGEPAAQRPAPADRTRLHTDLLRRGRVQLSVRWRDARDRLIASDPGLGQLRVAIRVLVAISGVLLAEWALARLWQIPTSVPMLLGGVIAMVTANGIRENTRRATLLVTAPAIPAGMLGVTLSILMASNRPLSVVGFVLLSFVAVWVRRFGGAWTTYGLVCWQAYFFVQFLHPPVSALPQVLAAVAVAGLMVTILLSTVLYEDPAGRVQRTVSALRARVRSAIAVAIDVLDDPDDAGAVRRLRSQLVRVSEVALLFDGQLSEARAIPVGVLPSTLRRWVVEVEVGVDELVRVVSRIGEGSATGPATDRNPVGAGDLARARQVLQALGWADLPAAAELSAATAADPQRHPLVRRIGTVSGYLIATISRWTSGELLRPGTSDEGADPDRPVPAFESVVSLRAGKLPGTASPAEAAVVDERAPRWSPARLALTTRQAIQAAIAAGLAIVVGQLISPDRYYWAVIAAFIAFTGTATASETVRRSIGRVVGTTAGLVAAVWLANLTADSPAVALVLLLLSVGLAWYVIAISYSAMIFLLTLALGQLYALLHTFTDQTMVLRLQETVVGAVIGGLVGALVLPAGSLRTLRAARRSFLETLAGVLDDCAAGIRAAPAGHPADVPLSGAVALDAGARQIVQATQSLIRGRFFGSDRAGLRRRVAVLGSAAAAGRRIALSLTRGFPADARAAAALDALAAEARRLAKVPRLEDPPATDAGSIADRVAELLDGTSPDVANENPGAPVRPAPAGVTTMDQDRIPQTIRRLADTLNLLTPRGRSGG